MDAGGTWRELNVHPAGVIRGALTIDPHKTATVYLGTARGVFKSRNGGRSWRSASAGLFGKETPEERDWRLAEGWVTELAIHSRSSRILYAGTYGGVAKSTDGGRRWRRVNAGLTIGGGGKRIPRPVWAVALDPRNSRTVYAAAIGGVFKSTNGGGRWRLAGRPRRIVQALALDPQKTQTLYAGTPRGVFKTRDGGSSWRPSGLVTSSVGSLALEPGHPQTVYAGTPKVVFKSTDGGGNWRSGSVGMAAVFVSKLVVDPQNPEILYAGTSEGLHKSTDRGGSWTLVLDPRNPSTASTQEMSEMKTRTWKTLQLVFAAGVATALLPAAAAKAKPTKPASASPIAALTWNQIAVNAVRSAVITADGPPRPVLQAEGRVYLAYVQAAVYDAVTKIEGRYVPYHDFNADPEGASPEAAVAGATRRTLEHYLPDQMPYVEAQYAAFLATLPDAGKAAGVAVGEAAAMDIIALRANDGRNAPTAIYGDPSLPVVAGLWQIVPPATTAATPWLAFMRPFMLESSSQFRLPPPPDLGTKRYADDLNETKAYGAKDSALRTPEQTATAYFWNANGINQGTQAFRDVAIQHGMDLVETARLLAMGEIVEADVVIACFDSKYHHLLWRPYTAIRHADIDGNPATDADPSWLPLLNTPNHPEYPGAHGCITGAFAEIVAKALHTRRIDVTVWGATNGGTALTTTRRFDTVKDLDREIVDARVWVGFHYRQSTIAGIRLGREVAHWTLHRYFRPVHGHDEENGNSD
jgi:photosystem II stability/assembly factor-like uncharacterized protein